MTNNNLGLAVPLVGWSKLGHTIGSEPRLVAIDEDQVLACIGLAVSAHGYAVQHGCSIISATLLERHHVVPSASVSSVRTAARLLVVAGVWEETPAGFDVGATDAIDDLRGRLERATRAGRASGNARRSDAGVVRKATPDEDEAPPAAVESPF